MIQKKNNLGLDYSPVHLPWRYIQRAGPSHACMLGKSQGKDNNKTLKIKEGLQNKRRTYVSTVRVLKMLDSCVQ